MRIAVLIQALRIAPVLNTVRLFDLGVELLSAPVSLPSGLLFNYLY